MSDSVRMAIEMSDGRVFHMLVVLRGRFPSTPANGFWRPETDKGGSSTGFCVRDAEDRVIHYEVNKAAGLWWGLDPAHPALPVRWRVVDDAEGALFERDRIYRDALTMRPDGTIGHDMPKARECHRRHIRRMRSTALGTLDAHWMRATGTADKKAAADVEAQRQRWRDAPADPRIEAAQTVDDLKGIAPP